MLYLLSVFQTCLQYWPTEDKPTQNYGPIEVTLVKTNDRNTLDTIITRDFIVKHMAYVCLSYAVLKCIEFREIMVSISSIIPIAMFGVNNYCNTSRIILTFKDICNKFN